jgi:hypothetical protein
MVVAMVRAMGTERASNRGIRGGSRDRSATSKPQFRRVAVVFWVMSAAAGLVGCSSSSGKPSGSGGMGSGGMGVAGMGSGGKIGTGGSDGGSDTGAGGSDGGNDSGVGGSDGGTVRHCHTNADCKPPDAGSPQLMTCVINAVITDCTTAPEGTCVPYIDGNCGTHPDPCDSTSVRPTCSAFPGTMCNVAGESNFNAQCFGCFLAPDASLDRPSDGDADSAID